MKKKLFASALTSIIISVVFIYWFYFKSTDRLISNLNLIICFLLSLIIVGSLWNLIRYKQKFITQIEGLFNEELLSVNKLHIFIAIIQTAIIITFFTCPIAVRIFDYHKPHLEQKGSTVGYYVIVENINDNEYTLPAEVIISYEERESTSRNTITGEETIKTNHYNKFIVYKAYFSNGGYLYLEDPATFSKPNDICRVTDQSGKQWNITLTNKYVENFEYEHIADIGTITYIECIFSLSGAMVLLIYLYIFAFKNKG